MERLVIVLSRERWATDLRTGTSEWNLHFSDRFVLLEALEEGPVGGQDIKLARWDSKSVATNCPNCPNGAGWTTATTHNIDPVDTLRGVYV
eukprot:1138889-Prorocentrum_minimum.AAC.3